MLIFNIRKIWLNRPILHDMWTKTAIAVLLLLLLNHVARTQTILRGKVLDRQPPDPLEMAIVPDLHSGRHYVTDDQGNFSLETTGTTSLKISMIGYTSQTVEAPPRQNLTIG